MLARNIPAWAVIAAAAVWALVVLAAYYPRLADVVPALLGIRGAPNLEWGSVRLPADLDVSELAHALWRVAGVVLLVWSATALGWKILQVLRLSGAAAVFEELLVATAVGLVGIAYAVGLLTLFDVLSKVVALLLLAALGMHAALWTVRREWRSTTGPVRAASPAGLGIERPLLVAASALAALFALVALLIALAPEVEYDALWYHLEFPQLALEEGHLVDLVHQYVSLYPQTSELAFAVGLAWDGAVAAKLVHLAVGMLAAGATYALARRFLSPAFSVLAAVLFVAAPTVLWEMTTAYNDLFLALFATLALSELLSWRDGHDRRSLVRAGLLFGLALATKHLALLFGPPLVLVLVVAARRNADWRDWLRRAVPSGAIFGAVAVAVALPWYLRSWLAAGNPVFPELYSVFGAPEDRWNDTTDRGLQVFYDHFGFGRSLLDLAVLPWNLNASPDVFGGSFGPLFFLAIPLAAIPGTSRRGLGLVALFAFAGFALWASPLASFQARFLVPLVPAAAVLAAAGVARIVEFAPRKRWVFGCAAGVATGLLALQLPPLVPVHSHTLWWGGGWITHTLREIDTSAVVDREAAEAYRGRRVHGYRAVAWANQHLPSESRLLSFIGGVDYYSRFQLIPDFAVVARPATWGSPPSAEGRAYAALRRLGVTHVVIDRANAELRETPLAITSASFRRRHLASLYRDDEAELYRVVPS